MSISRADLDRPARAASFFSSGDGVLEVAEQDVDPGRELGALATILSFEKSMKWIIRDGLKGISCSGLGARGGGA